MTEKNRVELKNCPFCGGRAWLRYDGMFYEICCDNIKCCGRIDHADEVEAINAWNKRAEV